MSTTPEILWPALRQYRHNNDNSPSITNPKGGFVVGLDHDETCSIFEGVLTENSELRDRIALLEDRIAFKDRFIKELEATAKLADAALTAIGALINESHGVAWLHLNGDIAPWGELLAGGRYEGWLIPLSDYWEALQEQEK